jgi:hypothetical protein
VSSPTRDTALRARADRLSRTQRRALLAAAAALLVVAAALSVFRSECTHTTREEVRDRAASSAPARVRVEETRCAPPTISSAPALALVLLAGLALSPWITRLTLGGVGLDTSSPSAPGSPRARRRRWRARRRSGRTAAASSTAPVPGSPRSSSRAPTCRRRGTGRRCCSPRRRSPVPDLIFAKSAPGRALDAERNRRLLELATPALNAGRARRRRGQGRLGRGLTTIAAAGTNLEGRPVSLVAGRARRAPAGPVPPTSRSTSSTSPTAGRGS